MSDENGHLDPDEFRAQATRWWTGSPITSTAAPAATRCFQGSSQATWPTSLPDRHARGGRGSRTAVWRDFEEIVLPGVTHWNHPGFIAYFGITGSGPGILGELLSAALNVNGMLWRTCPSATELELDRAEWLRRGRRVCPTSSSASSPTPPRSPRCSPWPPPARPPTSTSGERGMAGRDDLPPLRVYASDQAHSSIAKACLTLGFGLDGFRAVPHDRDYRMDVARARAGGDRGPRRRPPAAGRGRHRRHHLHHLGGPGAGDRRALRARKICGCTWTPPTPARRPCAPSTPGASMAATRPTAWSSTPTSGCSRRSTARPCTPATRTPSGGPSRWCPSTSPPR